MYARLLKGDYVNVKWFGAKGDGKHDDTKAIQMAIDNAKGNIVFFPLGTYLISNMIITSATENEKVLLNLGQSTIKAMDTFPTDKYMFQLGGKGSGSTYAESLRTNGITNGTIDGNKVAYGGIESKNTHLAKVINITVEKCTDRGITIGTSAQNGSSDAYIQYLMLTGTYKQDSIGLDIKGSDNNISYVRTNGFTIGIQVSGGGNYLTECHPLAWITNYYTDIGFNISGNDTYLNKCYADGFTTCIKISKNAYVNIDSFFALYASLNNKTNIFLNASECDYANFTVSKAVVRFPAITGEIVNIGYKGPFSVLYDSNAGFYNCFATALTNGNDPLVKSVLSHNANKNFTIINTTDLNTINSSGTWRLQSIISNSTNLHYPSNFEGYGLLRVSVVPKIYNSSWAICVQEIFNSSSTHKYWYRIIMTEDEQISASAWGNTKWMEATVSGVTT